MVNNSHFGCNTNDFNIFTEILRCDDEIALKKILKKDSLNNIIIKDIIKINTLSNNDQTNYGNNYEIIHENILKKSPLCSSFIDNKKIFFYLVKNYNYDFESFISFLIKNNLFKIFDRNFYKNLLKVNVNITKLNLYHLYSRLYDGILLDFYYSGKYLLNLIIKKDDASIKRFLKNIIVNLNIPLIEEFIEKRPFFLKTQLDYNYCCELMEILEYNVVSKYYDLNNNENCKKKDYNIFIVFELLLPFMKYNLNCDLISGIIKKYLTTISIKHNAVDFFNLMIKHDIPFNINYIDNMDFPILADCLKYGNTKTLNFLILNNVYVNNQTYFFPEEDLIDCSLFNFNYKVSEIFLNYVSEIIRNDNKCISNYVDNNKVASYVKTIFSNYYKKKYSGNTYCINKNKTNKIYKSSLKKQINLLYNFLNKESNYKSYNLTKKNIYLHTMLNTCVNEIIKENLSFEFFKKYDLSLLNIDSILKYNNIFQNQYYVDFFLDKINNETILHNFAINISTCCCKCKIDDVLRRFKEKGIEISSSEELFCNDANRGIVSFLENCKNCKKCCHENNMDYIINFYKKYYLKNQIFNCDSTIFTNYLIQYLEKVKIRTNYTINDLYKQYFLNGFNYINLFEKENNGYFYKHTIEYSEFVKGLRRNDIPLIKPLYAIVIINYNIKKFIQKRRQKNLIQYKSCLSKINNEFMFTPVENNKKINKFIGIEFKKQINKIFVKNPLHITPEHCVNNIHQTHKYITEKADGITARKSLKHISDLDYDFVVEYEKLDNINVVFNINNSDNVFENMMYLRNLHPYTPRIKEFYFNQENLEIFIEKEKKAYNEYINNFSGKLWWPKFVWILDHNNLIDYLESINNLKPLGIFKTDGYILYSNDQSQDIIKIKPFDLLTIDLKYKEGSWFTKENKLFLDNIINEGEKLVDSNIYRIYYDKKTTQYYCREQRTDKKHANNNSIVDYLVKCHKSQWTIRNIIDNLLLNNYYQVNNNSGLYLKNIIRKYSLREINYIHGNVLDFGCGYKQHYLKNNKVRNLLGVDVDVNVILNKNKNVKSNLHYALYDFTKRDNEQYEKFGEIYKYFDNYDNNKFDTIVLLNTIHNCFPHNQHILRENINKFANVDCFIVIRYLDRDIFHKNFYKNYIELNNYGYISKDSEEYINIYFNWRHKKQNKEYLVSRNDLVNLFDNCKLVYEENKKNNNDLSNIEKYFDSFKTIIFRY